MPDKGADTKAVNADADKADFADKFSDYMIHKTDKNLEPKQKKQKHHHRRRKHKHEEIENKEGSLSKKEAVETP